MKHYLIRATIIPEIISMIMEAYSMHCEEAMDVFYTSSVGASLADDETGLYGQSALYIFGLLIGELEDKKTIRVKTKEGHI